MLPNFKEISELIKKGLTIEAQEKFMELREGAVKLQEENLSLREQVRELESQLAIRGKVVWAEPYYWLEEDGKRDGPYCQKCYDCDIKLIRLQRGIRGVWNCRACNSGFTDGEFKR
ncbi:MAG: hypothetical protein IIB00_07625 [candidate division Zixibacteria bacterium]|nr:hypothetical protein [candidate division Zixibacteria bacterium]